MVVKEGAQRAGIKNICMYIGMQRSLIIAPTIRSLLAGVSALYEFISKMRVVCILFKIQFICFICRPNS